MLKRFFGTLLIFLVLICSMATPAFSENDGNITLKIIDGEAVVESCQPNATKVEIPASYQGVAVKRIASCAFMACSELSSVMLPSTIEVIEMNAFASCEALAKIDLPANLKIIDDYAFSSCKALTAIKIPAGVTRIGEYAFMACTSLSSVSIPSEVTNIASNAFDGCCQYSQSMFTYTEQDGKLTITGVLGGHPRNLIIPEKIGGIPVVAIGESAFLALDIDTVTLPNSLKVIGDGAFCDSTLKEVNYGTGLQKIGASAFANCKNLRAVVLPEGLIKIGEMAFINCDSIERLKLPSTLEEIDSAAFNECNSIKTVKIPSKVYILKESFQNCKGLETVIISSGVNFVSGYCFLNCTSLKNLYIAGAECGPWTFKNCTSLKQAVISEAQEGCFENCTALERVVVRDTVYFQERIFKDCTALKEVYFVNGPKLMSRTILDGCSSIPNLYFNMTKSEYEKVAMRGQCQYFDAAKKYFSVTPPAIYFGKFRDVSPLAWYYEEVQFAENKGIFKGTGDSTFSPEMNMTRAQFVQVFANLSGIDTSNNQIKTIFSDVKEGEWYAAAIDWASKNGIVNGVGDGKFNPNANVTREEMCVMLARYMESFKKLELTAKRDLPAFADESEFSSWALDAINKCADAGLINGVGENKFSAKAPANRAQGATIFTNFYVNYLCQ